MLIQKKTVLIATDNYLPRWDGIARVLAELIPRITKRFNIIVLAPDFGKLNKEQPNITLVRFPLRKKEIAGFQFAKVNKKVVRKYVKQADVVFSHSLGPICRTSVKIAKQLNKKVVCYIHSVEYELIKLAVSPPKIISWYYDFMVKLATKLIYKKADLLLIPNMEVKEILNKLGIYTPMHLTPLGVNTAKFKPAGNKGELKKKIGLEPTDFVIGYIGRLSKEKNLETLFQAFEILAQRYKNIYLLIVGKGIQKYTNYKHPRAKIIGQRNRIYRYYQLLDIYVLPSLTETTSLTTIEAMATGLPVITTPVGSIKYYIIDEYNGLIFPKKNYYILAKKIEKLMNNPKLMAKLSENARKTVVQKYNWNNTAHEVAEAISKL